MAVGDAVLVVILVAVAALITALWVNEGERNHQGLDNKLIDSDLLDGRGEIECRERLGGLLKYYHRAA